MKHAYPPRSPRGTTWYFDAALDILDTFDPGAIPKDVNYFLVGAIGAMLLSVAEDPRGVVARWEAAREKEDQSGGGRGEALEGPSRAGQGGPGGA